jgi:hypothetical protein
MNNLETSLVYLTLLNHNKQVKLCGKMSHNYIFPRYQMISGKEGKNSISAKNIKEKKRNGIICLVFFGYECIILILSPDR